MAGAPSPAPAPDQASPRPRVPHIAPQHLGRLRLLFAGLQAVSPALAARVALFLFLRTFRRALLPADQAALDQARRHRLMTDAGAMTVYEWGSGDHTAVILHGWGAGAARFTILATALQARGWRVLVPDAPGHGASPGRSSSLPRFIAGLDVITARFGPPQALIGHSLGALSIACRHATGAPDWAHQLESVVLISMPSGAPFLVKVFVDALGIRAPAQRHLSILFERRFAAGAEAFTAMPGATRIGAHLMVVHDDGDDIVPYAHSEELLRDLPGATLLATRDLGHSALTRDAATIEQIVRFVEANRV